MLFFSKNPSEFLSHSRQGFLRIFSYAKEIFLGILICRENLRAKNLPSMGTVFSHSSALKIEIFVVLWGKTTTDPVNKSMEILPLGPVVLIDTAGIDDEGVLGELRIKKTMQILNKTDIAVWSLMLVWGYQTAKKI